MKTENRQNLETFENAIKQLEKYLSIPIEDDRDKAGIIQAFEFSCELCWKTIQKLAGPHQISVGSPKQAFQAAFKLGWIAEEEQDRWLKLLNDRNLTSHTYQAALADLILVRIRDEHLNLLQSFLVRLKTLVPEQ